MSETKWTPEPWQTFEATIGVAVQVGEDEWEPMQIGSFARVEDAERSKQCVNALAGMESPETEIPALEARVKELEAELAKAEAQRDGLLEVAHDVELYLQGGPLNSKMLLRLQEAIYRAK